eukprot:NODE_93_length_21581_cov_0.291919.p11 type:complete len:129 gc:universal NODE_93_length_21581_cov_0.291919:3478-3092(-)
MKCSVLTLLLLFSIFTAANSAATLSVSFIGLPTTVSIFFGTSAIASSAPVSSIAGLSPISDKSSGALTISIDPFKDLISPSSSSSSLIPRSPSLHLCISRSLVVYPCLARLAFNDCMTWLCNTSSSFV